MSNHPPLNALHIFCTVVRYGGIRLAANVLHLTPGAISKQIRSLEAHLKETLFDRVTGMVSIPSPAGARLYDRVATHMESINDAIGNGTVPAKQDTVVVDTSITLAMHWLIPLLSQFHVAHPGTIVQVRTSEGAISTSSQADIFIRRDPTELQGLEHEQFMVENSILVCAPRFLAESLMNVDTCVQWVGSVPRISMRSRADLWSQWTMKQGISQALEPSLEYDNTILAIQAAIQGLGVLVAPEIFLTSMLASGTLIRLDGKPAATGYYHYAIGRGRDGYRVGQLTTWLASRSQHAESASVDCGLFSTNHVPMA